MSFNSHFDLTSTQKKKGEFSLLLLYNIKMVLTLDMTSLFTYGFTSQTVGGRTFPCEYKTK